MMKNKPGLEKPESLAPMQIGVHAKKQILDNLKNLEAAVFGLVAAIESRIYRDASDFETMEPGEHVRGADFLRPDDKALIRILANAFSEELMAFHNDLDEMQEIRELT